MEAKDFFDTLESMKGEIFPQTYDYCLKMLKEIEKRQYQTKKVSCSLEHCGTGKSTLIKVILRAYEQFPERFQEGVIVVTDNLKRLDGLAPDTAEEYNSVNSANKNEIMPKINQKPNLLLTTQRWAMMTQAEIRELLYYYQNGTKRARTMVFFDEKPNLYKHLRINGEVLSDVYLALFDGLNDKVPAEHKKFLINGYERFRERMTAELEEREERFSTCLYYDKYHSITGNDTDEARFDALINEYMGRLTLYDHNFPLYIRGIKMLISRGAIFTSHKQQKDGIYEKSFHVGLDAREQFDIGAKIFVLDATAGIDPLYEREENDFVEFFPPYIPRTYDKLEIICHDVNTSKTALFEHAGKELTKLAARTREAIYQYLSEKFPNPNELAVFTYKNLAPEFENRGYITGYFGNLKGQNDFREVQYLAHVGLNRCPDSVYLQILQVTNPAKFEELALNHPNKDIKDCEDVREAIAGICQNAVLADLIQNICRICIRCNNNQRAIVNLFYGQKYGQYQDLCNELEKYFYGAIIKHSNEVSKKLSVSKIKDRNNRQKSIAQRIIEWKESKQSGYTFTTKDLQEALGITQKQINIAKRKNKGLKEMFDDMRDGNSNRYIVD